MPAAQLPFRLLAPSPLAETQGPGCLSFCGALDEGLQTLSPRNLWAACSLLRGETVGVKSHAEGLGVAALSRSPLVTLADSTRTCVTGHQEVTTIPRAPGKMLPLRVALCIGHVCCRFCLFKMEL